MFLIVLKTKPYEYAQSVKHKQLKLQTFKQKM